WDVERRAFGGGRRWRPLRAPLVNSAAGRFLDGRSAAAGCLWIASVPRRPCRNHISTARGRPGDVARAISTGPLDRLVLAFVARRRDPPGRCPRLVPRPPRLSHPVQLREAAVARLD